MAQQKVRLVHDGVSGHYDAPVSAVAFWESRGWRRADAPRTGEQAQVRTRSKDAGKSAQSEKDGS
ncbi:hypothetical protein CDO52_12970 [Nocardiopsis gilva YIM 90087]|uniref:Uncharacterized protein n=1 Tax=Nocardiopsis gilva YIM 90087 TaxID=1235441 RepID=A0A223S656_9ACTN|nr:hypothetical protein [Nocardiopsis gilva]ASU83581.1 hypothetical protein CDO52_12970 [Nocardiopsis gilva YIM 90087]